MCRTRRSSRHPYKTPKRVVPALAMPDGIRYASRERSTDFGRNHAGRPRHRLVRTEGARLGLADTAASEPHATSALADERLIVQRRRSQDDAAPCGDERRPTEDDGEARNGATEDGEAWHRQAHYRQAHYREARHRKTEHREARRPEDDGSAEERRAIDREAHDTPQLDPQEAPLG